MSGVSQRAARDLEWQLLLEGIAQRCVSEPAHARVSALRPADSLDEARSRMLLTAQSLEKLDEGDPVPAYDVVSVDGVLERLKRGGGATAPELRNLAQTLAAAHKLRRYAGSCRPHQPQLADALDSDEELDELLRQIDRAIDRDGLIKDGASSELGEARGRVRGLRRSLQDKLEQLTNRYADVLRDRVHVERDGRFGLPVRADAHRRVDGIVLGSSGSGATLFIEPRQITEIGNRLKMAEGEVEREEIRVLAELSSEVRGRLTELAASHEACVTADVQAALSAFAQQAQAVAVVPVADALVDLRGMRHPLLVLQGGPVVANEIAIASAHALVVSGPNAGGKTVALKSLGLAVWMAQTGLPLPVAAESRVGWFSQVLTAFGDQQSLARSLSTFSAEITDLCTILDNADAKTLVLLDELAGATDPEEGSALAAAVLEALIDRGCAVVTTTHYERLKELAAQSERFDNASVGFDFERMQPTFELTMGIPGASSALAVASRHGLPQSVVDRAEQLLPEVTVQREQLLAELERERRALADARAAAEQDAAQAQTLRRESEAERQVVRRKERQRLADETAELTRAVRDARARLRQLSGELKTPTDRARLREAERQVDQAGKLVAFDGPLGQAARPPAPEQRAAPAAAAALEPGTRVFVPRLGTMAEVVERPERGQVRVQAGAFNTRVPVDELRLAAPAGRGAQDKPAPRRPTAPSTPSPQRDEPLERALRTSVNTCDLRGMRVDEAETELDVFIDRCLSANEAVGFVLHGHGTGALKRAMRDHLAASQLIAHHRPAELEEGGDAFSVFWLRR